MRTVHGAEGLQDDWGAGWGSSVASARQRLRDAGTRPGPVLEELVTSVSELVDAPAWVAVNEPSGLICRAASWEVRRMLGRAVEVDGTACGWVVSSGVPYRLDDADAPPGSHVTAQAVRPSGGEPSSDSGSDSDSGIDSDTVIDLRPVDGHPLDGPAPSAPVPGGPQPTPLLTPLPTPPPPVGIAPGSAPLLPIADADGVPAGGSLRSALVVPLVNGRHVLGVVVLTAAEPHWFGDDDTRVVQEVAATASAVLTAAQLPPTQPLALAMLYDDLAAGRISVTDAMLRAEAPLAAVFAPRGLPDPEVPALRAAPRVLDAPDSDAADHDAAMDQAAVDHAGPQPVATARDAERDPGPDTGSEVAAHPAPDAVPVGPAPDVVSAEPGFLDDITRPTFPLRHPNRRWPTASPEVADGTPGDHRPAAVGSPTLVPAQDELPGPRLLPDHAPHTPFQDGASRVGHRPAHADLASAELASAPFAPDDLAPDDLAPDDLVSDDLVPDRLGSDDVSGFAEPEGTADTAGSVTPMGSLASLDPLDPLEPLERPGRPTHRGRSSGRTRGARPGRAGRALHRGRGDHVDTSPRTPSLGDLPFPPLTEGERRIGAEIVREHLASRFEVAPATTSIPMGATRVSHMATPGGLGLWDWDGVSGKVTWSEPVSRLLNLPPDAPLTLESVRSVLHPDERTRFDETVARVGRGEGAAGSLRVTWGDGETRHIYAWGEARRNEQGEVVGAWGAVVDVTERAQDAAVLRSSLVGLRAAQQLTGLGVWEWHPESGDLVWSPEMFRLVGLEPGARDPSITMWHGFVHPEDIDKARRLDVLAAHHDGGSVENFRIIGADGEIRHVQSWSTVVAADDGSPRAVCGATVDVTPQVLDRELLERLSATDAVTGLGNRLAFDRHMQSVLNDSGKDVAVLLLDLDRFKTVNDSLGHQVGDRLLVEAARRISAVVPEGGITARMGGDEFVVVPRPGLGWLQVRRLAQAIVDALRAPYVLPESGEMLVCPASVGVTSTSGRRVDVSDLLREADLALYRAKDSGRDRFVVFDDVLRARAQSRHQAERDLRQALEDGRLHLEYQPIVDCRTGSVIGAEALVRLRGADGERLVEPEAFIDVAEDTGLVVELDCWVIDTAIREIGRWVESGAAHAPWLAINVSARSMEHPKVARRLLEAIADGRLPLDRIKLELTEHSFLGALPGGESTLRQLLAAGMHVGIDDFGTGYSALAYLQRFDLDFMKIDRSFVKDVGRDPRADAVVTAIVDLAHAHGMRVTAEGVETDEQANRLCEIGCDHAQGYRFGVPGPPDAILRA